MLPGEILNKRYRIIEKLGAGRYSTVYRAYDVRTERQVAVKEMLLADRAVANKFRSSVNALTRLEHPQLPKVIDQFVLKKEAHYLLSEYVDGVSLQTLVDQYGPLPNRFVVDVLAQLEEPLRYLHAKKRPHLNIKPANIRIDPAGTVHLVDFRLLQLRLPPSDVGYAAPEEQQATDPDFKADIYRLGGTLYTLLCGKAPTDPVKRELEMRPLPSAREVNPHASTRLSLIAGRAMSTDPELRFGSVEAFVEALQRPENQVDEYGIDEAEQVADPRAVRRKEKEAASAGGYQAGPLPQLLPQRRKRQVQMRVILGLSTIFGILLASLAAIAWFNQRQLVGGDEVAATATTESQVIAALTAVAPTATNTPVNTPGPTPTPAPLISETGMRMLFMPGGVFRFGSNEGEPDEAPSLLINIDSYYIDETEVTNKQYRQCVEEGECVPPYNQETTHGNYSYTSPAFDDYPVVSVDWYMADTFCRWRGGRLPTEAEWERAAGYNPFQLQRALYPWGEEFVSTNLNYCDANCPTSNIERRDSTVNDGHGDTAPVGSYPDGRSPLGAYDMLGNVMEWVDDWYDDDYYEEAPPKNPRGPAGGEFKALRGGSWLSTEEELRVTARGHFDPTVARTTLGFRCALPAP